eukprot:TRINITY_DN40586_c0_g4_i2.p1 TRINITY_DN40586_c0_g4~~TRINITY_DN40586_c0_g4_i2.p1  ORF type:complete len:493 (-),score=56.83 TRINITY_DN40586_c0_g4_i2:477-1955(-)
MNLEGVLEQASRQNTSCGQKVRLLRNNSNLFSQHAQQLSDLLNSVDPAINTLPCLSILVGFVNSKAFNTNGLKEVFLKGVEGFIERCVAWEIGYMSREFNEVCRGYKQKILDKPKKGVQTLLIAFQKLNQSQKAESTQRGLLLTLVHVDLFQLCLLSKCYNLALEAVTQDAIDMDPKRTGMTSTDFLLYCCYGGRICIGLRMYSRALELMQLALEAPTHSLNSITEEVYKKYVLVHLMHVGRKYYMPRHTSNSLQRFLRNSTSTKPYNDLMDAFTTENEEKMKEIVTQESQTFNLDGNLGLVKLLPQALQEHKIKKLTDTYLTLSLIDISQQVGLSSTEEAESRICHLIEKGEIDARIDSQQGMVLFIDQQLATNQHQKTAPSPSSTPNGITQNHTVNENFQRQINQGEPLIFMERDTLSNLKNRLLQFKQLTNQLGILHDEVVTDKAYQSRVMQRQRQQQKSQEAGDDDESMDPGVLQITPDVPGASEAAL